MICPPTQLSVSPNFANIPLRSFHQPNRFPASYKRYNTATTAAATAIIGSRFAATKAAAVPSIGNAPVTVPAALPRAAMSPPASAMKVNIPPRLIRAGAIIPNAPRSNPIAPPITSNTANALFTGPGNFLNASDTVVTIPAST